MVHHREPGLQRLPLREASSNVSPDERHRLIDPPTHPMPIVDVQLVSGGGGQTEDMAASIANALADVFQAQPGRVWVRISYLPSSSYAENDITEAPLFAPVFVRVLHADLPPLEALALEASAVAKAVGMRPAQRSSRSMSSTRHLAAAGSRSAATCSRRQNSAAQPFARADSLRRGTWPARRLFLSSASRAKHHNRAINFRAEEAVPEDALRFCIAAALLTSPSLRQAQNPPR